MYWKRSNPNCNGNDCLAPINKVELSTACIENVKFRIIKIRTGCQYSDFSRQPHYTERKSSYVVTFGSTTATYLSSCFFMYIYVCLSCYCHACFKSTALRVGVKTLYNTTTYMGHLYSENLHWATQNLRSRVGHNWFEQFVEENIKRNSLFFRTSSSTFAETTEPPTERECAYQLNTEPTQPFWPKSL